MFRSALPLAACSMIVLFIFIGQAQEPETTSKMKTYYLVLLHKGPHRDQDSITAKNIQEGHLANINRLAKEGKLDMAGPLLDDGDIRGIFVLNVGSMHEAESLMITDPAIAAGRLKPEIHPWYSQQGATLR